VWPCPVLDSLEESSVLISGLSLGVKDFSSMWYSLKAFAMFAMFFVPFPACVMTVLTSIAPSLLSLYSSSCIGITKAWLYF
jgi:hypothetical protein